jgi:protein O-GlcNAc transferase
MDPMKHLLTVPWLSREGFYRLLDLSDVYLDCPSFSGYTTAWQSVHRGLPVVTLEGGFMRRRLAAGLLRKIGVTDTIASCMEEYAGMAARLAEESRDAQRRRGRREALKAASVKADQDVTVVKAFERNIIDALSERT